MGAVIRLAQIHTLALPRTSFFQFSRPHASLPLLFVLALLDRPCPS